MLMVRITSWPLSSIHIHEISIRFIYSDLTLQIHFPIICIHQQARRSHGWWARLQIKRSRFTEPWPGHCVVFLGKTLLAVVTGSASFHPGIQMETTERT